MSPKRWILLLIFYISYLMFGASIYYHIEHGEERQQREEELKERIEINEYLLEQLANKNDSTKNEILEKISDYCGKPVTDYTQDENDIPYTWTFYHAFFFAFTVCSTVGYGNISPTTTLGRMIMIVYSVIGIPVNGILFAGIGEYFGRTFEAIYRRYKKYKMSNDMHYVPPQLGLITTVVMALVPGIAIFLLLPSWVFSYFEDWPYSISFYYTYVTTTTIGFGDYVPTFGANQPREFGGWFVVYQIFVIIWFIFSLGYLLMIMTFITRGLQSKKLKYLEQQLSTNLKATQNRIWNGVTKDVGYLRRLLNELYILKVKPVYSEMDTTFSLYRSQSCPELSMYRTEPAPLPSRQRAFSVAYDASGLPSDRSIHPLHASSDTELSKYDREKTFETAEAYRQTTDLLAKVVTALATVKPPPEEDDAAMFGAYHGLPDSQILASEWSFSTVNDYSTPPNRPRGRAASEFNIKPHWQAHRPMMPHNEWTWSGDNDQIQEAINNRYKQNSAAGGGEPPYAVQSDDMDVEQQKKAALQPRVKKFSMPDGLRRLFPFKKRLSHDVGPTRKFSIVSVPEVSLARRPEDAPMDYFSTLTNNATPAVVRSGKSAMASSSNSLGSRHSLGEASGGIANPAFSDENEPHELSLNANASSYQRNPTMGATKKRRESIYAQNPAISGRRGSLFTTNHMPRRGSLAPSGSAAMAAAAARRGSLFPATAAMGSNARRGSIFSVTSDKDMDVLEHTTLADLIRALEVVHTHAVIDEQQQAATNAVGVNSLGSAFGGGAKHKSDKKQRKYGNAGLEPPQLPPILSLFAGDQTRTLAATAANRLYARRSTIVGTMPAPTALTQRRRPSAMPIAEPPPSYSEKPSYPQNALSVSNSKFRRRFSVRPTALQIPPGQAPPAGAQLNSNASQSQPSLSSGAAPAAFAPAPTLPTISQTALQRRLSLRPSPLARELNLPTSSAAPSGSTGNEPSAAAIGSTSTSHADTLTSRLLPQAASISGQRTSTSSTHSPLSRIVQISQAQRKSSMPDGFGLTRKSKDGSSEK